MIKNIFTKYMKITRKWKNQNCIIFWTTYYEVCSALAHINRGVYEHMIICYTKFHVLIFHFYGRFMVVQMTTTSTDGRHVENFFFDFLRACTVNISQKSDVLQLKIYILSLKIVHLYRQAKYRQFESLCKIIW